MRTAGGGEQTGRAPATDPTMFREITTATLFEASDASQIRHWAGALAELVDDLSVAQGSIAPADVILRHACRFVDADVALLSVPIQTDDPHDMQIRAAWGAGAETLRGQLFDRSSSIAGQVLDSGRCAFVGLQRLRSPLADIESYGPMIIAPITGLKTTGTLGVARLHAREPLTPQQMEAVVGFAVLASIALQVDQARADREAASVHAEHDRLATALLESLIRDLFSLSLGMHRLIGASEQPAVRLELRALASTVDDMTSGIRSTIYHSRPAGSSGVPDF